MSIESIKLVKCNIEHVKTDLGRLDLSTDGSLKQLVARLAEHYDTNADNLQIAECDVCGAGSDAQLDACPFCGTKGVVDDSEQPESESDPEDIVETEGEESESAPQHVTRIGESPDDGPDVDDDVSNDDPEAESSGEDEAAAADGGESEEPVATKGAKKKGAAKAKPEKTVKAKSEKAKPAAKEVKAPKKGKKAESTELVAAPEVESHVGMVVTEADLDIHIEEVRRSFSEGAVALHRVGKSLEAIQAGDLWKLRVDKKGVPLYKNFKHFVVEEIGLSPAHAYRALDAAKNLTEEQVQGLSTRQLRIVLQLPAGEQRNQVLEGARNGEGSGKLTERANALRGGREPIPEPKKGLTIAVAQERMTVKLYAKPTTGRSLDTEEAKRAKKLGDEPWGKIELSNKVTLVIRMGANKNTGELAASLQFIKGTPAI